MIDRIISLFLKPFKYLFNLPILIKRFFIKEKPEEETWMSTRLRKKYLKRKKERNTKTRNGIEIEL